MWGTILDFAQVELALVLTIAPCEIAVAAPTDADFCGCIGMAVKLTVYTHENPRGNLYLTLFTAAPRSTRRPFRAPPRSLGLVG